jgi:hypothetical protein
MNTSDTPRPYEEWRTASLDRAEDAAYTFGRRLMQHCRGEALKAVEFVKRWSLPQFRPARKSSAPKSIRRWT